MLKMIAIADTCFLIDWIRYRRREILFQLFNIVFVPESVLNEIKSEKTIMWICEKLIEGKLVLFTETSDIISEARSLVERSRSIPHMIGVDYPEAMCLVVGRLYGYTVLTENRGALMVPLVFNEYRNVKVWRSLEIIYEALKRNIIRVENNDFEKYFKEYCEDTYHIFPRRDLEQILRELKCMRERKN